MTRHLVIALAVIACASGCKRKRTIDGRLDELVHIRDDACACRDIECAKFEQTAFTAWNFRNDSTDAAKMTEAQRNRFATLRHQLDQCLMRGARGGRDVGSDN